LQIKLDKKLKKKVKGIIVRYRDVINAGYIVIVNGEVMEKIES